MAIGTLLSFSILWLTRRRFDVRTSVLSLLLLIMGTIAGCSSGTTSAPVQRPVQEVGTKTILINATCGSLTKSAPLTVAIH